MLKFKLVHNLESPSLWIVGGLKKLSQQVHTYDCLAVRQKYQPLCHDATPLCQLEMPCGSVILKLPFRQVVTVLY